MSVQTLGNSARRVGWIGLGAMGWPMAERLAASGHQVVAYDVSEQNLARAGGVLPAKSVAAAATGVSALFVMVATPEQARDVLLGPDGALAGLGAGCTVVVTSTVGPDAMAELASAITARGVGVVDAPVSGGTARAASGELLAMVGATDEDFASVRELLDALADRLVLAGPRPGDGQRFKLVNQLLCGVHIAVAAEALAFAGALGLDPRQCWEVLNQGAAASFMFADRGERMLNEQFHDVRSAVDIFVKDMGLVNAGADAVGFDAELARLAGSRFQRAHAAGLGRLDDSSVVKTYVERDQA